MSQEKCVPLRVMRQPLRLSWKRPSHSAPVPQIPGPPVNTPPPPPPPRPLRIQPIEFKVQEEDPPPLCWGKCPTLFPHVTHAAAAAARHEQEEEEEVGVIVPGAGFGVDDLVIAKLPLDSLMTASTVCRAWKRKLMLPRFAPSKTTQCILVRSRSGGFVAFNTLSKTWSHLPASCSWPPGLPSSSCLLDSANGLVCIGPAVQKCHGRFVVGNPLTHSWADVVLPVEFHRFYSRKNLALYVALLPGSTGRSFLLVTFQLAFRNKPVLVYNSVTGQWSELEPMSCPHPLWYGPGVGSCVSIGTTLYLLEQQEHAHQTLVIYSLDTQECRTVDLEASAGRIYPCGRILQCAGRILFAGLRLREESMEEVLCVWYLDGNKWILEAEYGEVSRPGGINKLDHGYCSDGEDMVWVLRYQGCIIGYSLSTNTWSQYPAPCPSLVPATNHREFTNHPEFTSLDLGQFQLCPECH